MKTKTYNNPIRFVRINEVVNICGLSISTIRKLELSGKFPKRIKISEKAAGWDYQEIIEWMTKQKQRNKHENS